MKKTVILLLLCAVLAVFNLWVSNEMSKFHRIISPVSAVVFSNSDEYFEDTASDTDIISQTDTSDVILIHNANELISISDAPEKSYRLAADIDLSGTDWVPLVLTGEFDGGGYTIYNLTVTSPAPTVKTTVDGNHIKYNTVMGGLFSAATNAKISNVTLKGALINIHAEYKKNCFAALLAGYAVNTDISNCSVSGRVYLYSTGRMCGVGGLVGFGYGNIDSCYVDAELVIVDENTKTNCEEFLGGIVACGYPNIYNCDVKLQGYASVHGYVHNGGLIGMHHIHDRSRKSRVTYIKNTSVSAYITFFEDNTDRRAYCKKYVGERLHNEVEITGCKTVSYKSKEVKNYNVNLFPEKCKSPQYVSEIIPYTCTDAGYTIHSCSECGYSYTDSYTLPAHTPAQWTVTIPATTENTGLKEQICAECGELLASEEISALTLYSSCTFAENNVTLNYKESDELTYVLTPETVDVNDIIFISSDEDIIKVDNSGKITAVGTGIATVTCTTPDGRFSASCDVMSEYSFLQWLIIFFLFGWIWY